MIRSPYRETGLFRRKYDNEVETSLIGSRKAWKERTASPQTGWSGYRAGDGVKSADSTWLKPDAATSMGLVITTVTKKLSEYYHALKPVSSSALDEALWLLQMLVRECFATGSIDHEGVSVDTRQLLQWYGSSYAKTNLIAVHACGGRVGCMISA